MAVVFDENIPNITLYASPRFSGLNITIALEELGLPYEIKRLASSSAGHEGLANTTGRIPTVTDTFTDGDPINIFGIDSTLQYLVEQYDPNHKISYPKGTRESYEVNNLVFPPLDDHKEPDIPGMFASLDKQLKQSKSGYLVGDKISIADIAVWGRVTSAERAGFPVRDEFPLLQQWMSKVVKRMGVERKNM